VSQKRRLSLTKIERRERDEAAKARRRFALRYPTLTPPRELEAPANPDRKQSASVPEFMVAALFAIGMLLDIVGLALVGLGFGPYVLYAGLVLTALFAVPGTLLLYIR